MMFYFRKLWESVFEIRDLKTNVGMFYTYFEGTAQKGLMRWLPFCNIILNKFSDACGGQNCNHIKHCLIISVIK